MGMGGCPWEMVVGQLCRPPPSWFLNDWSEVAEVIGQLEDGFSLLWCEERRG